MACWKYHPYKSKILPENSEPPDFHCVSHRLGAENFAHVHATEFENPNNWAWMVWNIMCPILNMWKILVPFHVLEGPKTVKMALFCLQNTLETEKNPSFARMWTFIVISGKLWFRKIFFRILKIANFGVCRKLTTLKPKILPEKSQKVQKKIFWTAKVVLKIFSPRIGIRVFFPGQILIRSGNSIAVGDFEWHAATNIGKPCFVWKKSWISRFRQQNSL